jgi:cytochrome c oxidase cbb3-type subunit 4
VNAASIHSWWTIALLVIFVGIVIWTWSDRRKAEFDEAARIPLEDDDEPAGAGSEESRRG